MKYFFGVSKDASQTGPLATLRHFTGSGRGVVSPSVIRIAHFTPSIHIFWISGRSHRLESLKGSLIVDRLARETVQKTVIGGQVRRSQEIS